MTNYFHMEYTGPKDFYRAKNFIRRLREFFGQIEVSRNIRMRINNNDPAYRKGLRYTIVKIPESLDHKESYIHIEEIVYDLPERGKKKWKKRDHWGRQEKIFTKIEVKELSGKGFQKGKLEDILRTPEFLES